MTILRLGVVIALAACARPYVPAGSRQLDATGVYDTRVSLFSTTCRGVPVRDTRIVVDHAPGATALKLAYEGLSFDAKVRPDGNFTIDNGPFRDASGVAAVARIEGRFADSTLTARVFVERPQARCGYQL